MPESSDTKMIIADGFRIQMQKKPFEKITVQDITDQCGLNRQTFYYHFQDKYELLNWVFYNEIIDPFTMDITIDNWSDKLLALLEKMKEDPKFYTNAFKTPHGEEFRKFLLNAVKGILCDVIDMIAGGQPVDPDDKLFIAEFMAYGITGTISKWVMSGMKRSPKSTTEFIKNLVDNIKSFIS